jgi:formiminoglutamase
MKYFKFTEASDLKQLIDYDTKGEKFGERVVCISKLIQLESTDADYVLFGLPSLLSTKEGLEIELSDMFQSVLEPLLNIQNNQYNRGENLVILGQFDLQRIMKDLDEYDSKSEKIIKFNGILKDTISKIIEVVYDTGKIPIAIGGHPSDTLNIVKALSEVHNSSINLLDLSTKVNLQIEENEIQNHENNSWLESLKLNKYAVFGLNKNYASQKEIEVMNFSKKLNFHFFEDCLHLTTLDKCVKFKNAVDFHNGELGFRLDLNSVLGMCSKCESSSGFSMRDIRTFIKMIRKENVQFFHICGLDFSKKASISNTLSYLVSDFIREED